MRLGNAVEVTDRSTEARKRSIKFNTNTSITRVVHIRGLRVELPTVVSEEPLEPRVQILEWTMRGLINTIYGLAHPVFSHLVALRVTVDFPFPRQAAFETLRLPLLRCFSLVVRVCEIKWSEGRSFSAWAFPKLAMFELWANSSSRSLSIETREFLRGHAETVEEVSTISYSRFMKEQRSLTFSFMRELWPELPAVRRYRFFDLHEFVQGLPAIPQLWIEASTCSHPGSSKFCAIIGNAGLDGDSVPVIAARLKQESKLMANVNVTLDTSWANLLNARTTIWFQRVEAFFKVIDDVGIKALDANGEDSSCLMAMEVRAAVEGNCEGR